MLTIVTSFTLFLLFSYSYFILSIEGATGKCGGEDTNSGAQWVWCASHTKDSSDSPEQVAGECVIPSSINEGFLSYGRGDRFILIPFSNYGTNDLKILCNDAFGDPYPGVGTETTQHCCYTNIEDMNNQFGRLNFLTTNKLDFNAIREFKNEAVIESFNLTENQIKSRKIEIGSKSYHLMPSNFLNMGVNMNVGWALLSLNKQFALVIESDGELAIYRTEDDHKLWFAGTSGSGNSNFLQYQQDGNLVLRRGVDGSHVWSIEHQSTLDSNTGYVNMQDDGNLVVRNSNNDFIWGSWGSANSNQYIWSNAPVIIRYGNNNRYTYRAYTNSKVKCHYDVGLGNILTQSSEINACHWTYDNTASGNPSSDIGHLPANEWVSCGVDGADCTGLQNSIPQWVRFGGSHDGLWEYQLVLTKDNKIPCHASVFNYWDFNVLTHNVENKRCERTKSPQYEFYDIAGTWEEIASCSGKCDGLSHTTKYGVTRSSEHEMTHQWGISITRSASMDYKMFGASQEMTMSYDVAHRTLTSEVFTTEADFTINCPAGTNIHMYQWKTTAIEFIATSKQGIIIKTKAYLCTSSTSPTCAPGHCKDISL